MVSESHHLTPGEESVTDASSASAGRNNVLNAPFSIHMFYIVYPARECNGELL